MILLKNKRNQKTLEKQDIWRISFFFLHHSLLSPFFQIICENTDHVHCWWNCSSPSWWFSCPFKRWSCYGVSIAIQPIIFLLTIAHWWLSPSTTRESLLCPTLALIPLLPLKRYFQFVSVAEDIRVRFSIV